MRKFPAVTERVESGAIQFGDDWKALHLRGDDAFALLISIRTLISNSNDDFAATYLTSIADLIENEVICP